MPGFLAATFWCVLGLACGLIHLAYWCLAYLFTLGRIGAYQFLGGDAERKVPEAKKKLPPHTVIRGSAPTFDEWDRQFMLGELPEDRAEASVAREADGTIILRAKEPSRYHRNLIPGRRPFTRGNRGIDRS